MENKQAQSIGRKFIAYLNKTDINHKQRMNVFSSLLLGFSLDLDIKPETFNILCEEIKGEYKQVYEIVKREKENENP